MTDETVHLEAPETPENEGANLYCPFEKALTKFYLGHSADGMEVYACGACNEPEPETQEVTEAELEAIVHRLNDNQ
jgi:hypothetical protein